MARTAALNTCAATILYVKELGTTLRKIMFEVPTGLEPPDGLCVAPVAMAPNHSVRMPCSKRSMPYGQRVRTPRTSFVLPRSSHVSKITRYIGDIWTTLKGQLRQTEYRRKGMTR